MAGSLRIQPTLAFARAIPDNARKLYLESVLIALDHHLDAVQIDAVLRDAARIYEGAKAEINRRHARNAEVVTSLRPPVER